MMIMHVHITGMHAQLYSYMLPYCTSLPECVHVGLHVRVHAGLHIQGNTG